MEWINVKDMCLDGRQSDARIRGKTGRMRKRRRKGKEKDEEEYEAEK